MSLARLAVRGAALLTVTNLTAYAVSFGATLALARMLEPNEFGKVVFAIAVAEFLFLLGAWSLPVALIREPQETFGEAFDTAMALLVPISGGLLVASAGVAAGLWALEGAAIALVFLAIAGGRVLQLFAGCFIACLERDFAYGRVALIQIGSIGCSAVIALALAQRGAGVWALGARDVAVSVVMCALAVALTRRLPGRMVSAAKARALLRFGAGMVGSRLGEMLFQRYHSLVLGVVSGARQLGLYNQGYVLTEAGNRLYGPVLQQLPLATYARIQDDRERTARVFALVMFVLSRGVTPLALAFLVLPGETLAFLYGERWREGASMLRVLSVYALLAPLFDQMRVLLVANGRVGNVLRARMWQLGLFLPAVPLCSWLWGGVGAAAAVGAGMIVGVLAILPYVRRLAPLSWRDFVAPGVAATASVAAAFAVLSTGVERDFPRLALGGLTLATMYALALALVDGARLLAHGRTILAGLRPAPPREDGRPASRAGVLGAARATSRG